MALRGLTAEITHDINNQLATIAGFAELMAGRLKHNPQVQRYAGLIALSAQSATRLASRLMLSARPAAHPTEPVDMHKVIREITPVLKPAKANGIALVLSLQAAQPSVHGDHTQLQCALLNLVLNARDAMPDGGQLTITTENVTLRERKNNSQTIRKQRAYLHITVRDTGIGMDEKTQQLAFEPFFTTKEASGGTGVGLAAVHRAVTSHGGRIEVASREGEGALFSIYLPSRRKPQARVGTRNCDPAG